MVIGFGHCTLSATPDRSPEVDPNLLACPVDILHPPFVLFCALNRATVPRKMGTGWWMLLHQDVIAMPPGTLKSNRKLLVAKYHVFLSNFAAISGLGVTLVGPNYGTRQVLSDPQR